MFDQLDRAGLSWKYYVEGYKGVQQAAAAGQQSEAPVLAMPTIAGDPARASHIVDTNQYFDDLLDGKLPAVSYVAGTVDSERSPLDPTLGEYFVQSLVNALMQSSAWKDTVLLLTYDSSGGWYDNVAPPVMGGQAQGIRVPMLMVSPFARAGVVDHSDLNTTAIPGMIDQVFGLPVLTSQSAAVGSLLSGADLGQTPITPLIAPLPGGATVAARPNVLVVYGLYLLRSSLPACSSTSPSAGFGGRTWSRTASPSPSPSRMAADVTPADADTGGDEEVAADESTGHDEVTPAVEDTAAVVSEAAPLFSVADVTNPYDSGTPGVRRVEIGLRERRHEREHRGQARQDSAESHPDSSSMRESGVSLEALLGITSADKRLKAASYTGMAAAHSRPPPT